jgi:hypothetical protein
MGPPLRSFAAESGLSSDRHRDRIERSVVLEAVKVWPGKGEVCRKVGVTANLDSFCAHRPQRCAGRDEETDFEIKSRNRRRKKMRGLANSLTKKAPYKGRAQCFVDRAHRAPFGSCGRKPFSHSVDSRPI